MAAQGQDIAIVGGGLAGGLTALALHRARPDLRIALIEAGETLGGNHRWSWFDSDLSEDGNALMAGFDHAHWPGGYDVAFPAPFPQDGRRLLSPYRSLASADFHSRLSSELPAQALLLGQSASAIDAHSVTLADGTHIEARTVIDCRDAAPGPHLSGGWQVFMGRHLRLDTPHGLTCPVIMDACVEQLAPHGNGAAYRFVYVLPLGEREVFIEDTYYADEPRLDEQALSARIDAYAHARGWDAHETLSQETGVLPVLTGGDFSAYQEGIAIPGVAVAGTRGGFTHPLTSYTVPLAVDNALYIARHAELSDADLASHLAKRARNHWRSTAYYRLLARMLFMAAQPQERWRIFARFYRLPEPLIERFYAARSSLTDRLRIVLGKPPVSVIRAVRALMRRGPPLA